MVEFCERYCRLGGFSFVYPERDSAAEQFCVSSTETVKEKGDYMKFSEQLGNCLNLCECDEGHEFMVQ